MAEVCPHCGAALPAIQDAFCPECRNNLADAPDEARPQAFRVDGGEATDRLAENVWYATENRVYRWSKMSWCDDRGSIGCVAGKLAFFGQAETLNMQQVLGVRHIGPIIPWAAVAGSILGVVLVLLLAKAGMFTNFTLETPSLYVVLAFITLFGFSSWPLTWVKVDFMDHRGQPRTAYFTVGSIFGRWQGGTGRLCAAMQERAGLSA
jgi:hypothetical protein